MRLERKEKLNMKNKKVLRMTLDAVLCALIAILSFVPYVGFIPLGFISVTDIHVVVIIGAILLGPKDGLLLGTWFGVCSLIKSFNGTSGDITFNMPWVSILPRMLFGFMAGMLNIWFKNIIKNKALRIGVVALLATIFHTDCIYVFYVPTCASYTLGIGMGSSFSGKIGNWNVTASLWIYCAASFAFSCLFESILAVLVCIPINRSLEAAYGDSILSQINFKKKDKTA